MWYRRSTALFLLMLPFASFGQETDKTFEERLREALLAKEAAQVKYGRDHKNYGWALYELSRIYLEMKAFEEALPVCLKVKEIMGNHVVGKEYTDYVIALNNLADLYQAMGSFEASLPLYHESLKKIEAILPLGHGHSLYYNTLTSVAHAYRALVRFEDAIPYVKKATEIARAIWDEEDYVYALTLCDLGDLYLALENYKDAIRLSEEAVEVTERYSLEEPQAYSVSLQRLSRLYVLTGDHEKALSSLEKIKAIIAVSEFSEDPRYKQLTKDIPSLQFILALKSEQSRDYKKAFLFYEDLRKSLNEAPEPESQLTNALVLFSIGIFYRDQGLEEKANQLIDPSLKIQEGTLLTSADFYDRALQKLIDFFEEHGAIEKAIQLAQECLKLHERVLDKTNIVYVNLLSTIGRLYHSLDQFGQAISFFNESLIIREQVQGRENQGYSNTLSSLGLGYQALGRYDEALPYFQESLEIVELIFGKEHQNYIGGLNNIGALYVNMELFEKALSVLLEAKSILENISDPERMTIVENARHLSQTYMEIGQYEQALFLLENAVKIAEKAYGRDMLSYAAVLNGLGLAYQELGLFEKSLPALEKSLAIKEKIRGRINSNYAITLNNLALSFAGIGSVEKAITLAEESIEIMNGVYSAVHPSTGKLLLNLGDLYTRIGDSEQAISIIEKTGRSFGKAFEKGSRSYLYYLNSLGLAYLENDLPQLAISLFNEAIEVTSEIRSITAPEYCALLNNLALGYLNTGNFEKALSVSKNALQLSEQTFGSGHPNYVSSLEILALVYYGNSSMDSCLMIKQKILQYYSDLINSRFFHFSEQEQVTRLWSVSFSHMHYQNMVFQQNASFSRHNEDLFNANLLLKGLLIENYRSVLTAIRKDGSPELQEKFDNWLYLKRQIGIYQSRSIEDQPPYLDSLLNEANRLERELNQISASFRKGQTEVSWNSIRDHLNADEAAIEFSHFQVFNQKGWQDSIFYVAYIIRSDWERPKSVFLFEEQAFRQLLKKDLNTPIENLYAGRGLTPKKKNITDAYQLLWAPIDSLLDDVKTIYYSPSGVLNEIALPAIKVDSIEVLSDRYKLRNMMSTRKLAFEEEAKERYISAVVYGGIYYEMDSTAMAGANVAYQPDYAGLSLSQYTTRALADPNDPWAYLEGTKKEAENIAGLMQRKGLKVELQSGYQASETAFKQIGKIETSPSILHIATHGFFFPDAEKKNEQPFLSTTEPVFKLSDNPLMRSGLVMAGANHVWSGKEAVAGLEDGILTAYEIAQMDLSNTELVVLSACETGLGEIRGSEGVYGLQRAFKMAGVKYLIMSLWAVPDKPTQELMTAFYYKWLEEEKPIHEAFYAAQKEMRQKYPDPMNWAGFVLVE